MSITPSWSSADSRAALYCADCLEVTREMESDSVDAIVTDPPYGLGREPDITEVLTRWLAGESYEQSGGGFMGKKWDSFVPGPTIWREAFRVLKPGGHALVFAGTRTEDLMGIALRLAGFERRDLIAWVYGSGFPKSHNISKAIDKAAGVAFSARPASGVGFMQPDGRGGYNITKNQLKRVGETTDAARQWDGWGSALKPAIEPILLVRKPLSEKTIAANVLKWGTGGVNVDGCRVGMEDVTRTQNADGMLKYGGANHRPHHDNVTPKTTGSPSGRFPANLIHSGEPEVVACFPVTKSGANPTRRRVAKFQNAYGEFAGQEQCAPARGANSGSASRFFQCCPDTDPEDANARRLVYQAKANKKDRGPNNSHPTVKPTALMHYLCRFITPPGGIILDLFTGSGSTGKAAMPEGFRFIGIEREPEYVEIAAARIGHAIGEPQSAPTEPAEPAQLSDLPLFAGAKE